MKLGKKDFFSKKNEKELKQASPQKKSYLHPPQKNTNKNMNNQTFQTLPIPTTDDLHDLFFLNEELGWVYTYGTGKVLKTEDGGATWQIIAQLAEGYYEQMQFLDKEMGWICGANGALLKTEDGGRTWVPQEVPVAGEGDLYVYALHFKNKLEGFIGGTCMVDRRNQTPFLYRTMDGGGTWQQLEQPPSMVLNLVFPSEKVGYLCCDRYILKTEDGGTQWETVFTAPPKGIVGMRGLHFFDETHGLCLGFFGLMVRTEDGGATWTSFPVSEKRGLTRDLYFFNPQEGFVVGDKIRDDVVLYRTNDGGTVWQYLYDLPHDLHRIKATAQYVWVVGKQGTIARMPQAMITT